MDSISIIIFAVLSAILLIFSCIALNAPKFYNELKISSKTKSVAKPTILLRNRSLYTLKDRN